MHRGGGSATGPVTKKRFCQGVDRILWVIQSNYVHICDFTFVTVAELCDVTFCIMRVVSKVKITTLDIHINIKI